jgi:hypothetical protein
MLPAIPATLPAAAMASSRRIRLSAPESRAVTLNTSSGHGPTCRRTPSSDSLYCMKPAECPPGKLDPMAQAAENRSGAYFRT